MKPLTMKQCQRMEKKKKKMAAFLEIAKLNDKDREAKETKLRAREESTSESSDSDSIATNQPSRKRIKKHHDLAIDSQDEPPEEKPDCSEGAQPIEADPCTFSTPATPEKASIGPSGKVLLSGQDLVELKKRLRERKRALTKLPLFRLKQTGDLASVRLKEDDRTPLFLSDIQHLLMYSLLANNAPYNPLAWCHVEKAKNITQTVFLLIEGLSLYDFQAHESCFPALSGCFSTKLEVITPSAYNGNFVEELALVPLTHNKENKLLYKYGSIEAAMKADGEVYKVLRAIFPVLETDAMNDYMCPMPQYPSLAYHDQFPRTQLIMSVAQLIEQEFPVPIKGPLKEKYKNYVLTKDLYSEVTPESPMFSLDCEMCMTTARGLELTRISIVDEQLNCLYDTLVLPYNRITNYLTQYSGITKNMLQDVTKRLEDVQEDIRQILPMDAILIGQSLNSDLHALRMMHPYVIDTSVIFNVTGDYKRKTKLSVLSLKFLGEEIQTSVKGHCSTEDSAACMKLVQLKLANSLVFGDTILASRQPEFRSLTQPVMTVPTTEIVSAWQEVLPQAYQTLIQPQIVQETKVYHSYQNVDGPQQNEHLASSMFNYFKHHDKSVAIVSTRHMIDEYSHWISSRMPANRKKSNKKLVECISATSKENVILKVGSASSKHALTIGHLLYDSQELETVTNKELVFREVDSWCGKLWEKMSMNGLCVIMFGGRQGGANGACFIQLKRRDSPGVPQDKH